jgi:hypothetical protein
VYCAVCGVWCNKSYMSQPRTHFTFILLSRFFLLRFVMTFLNPAFCSSYPTPHTHLAPCRKKGPTSGGVWMRIPKSSTLGGGGRCERWIWLSCLPITTRILKLLRYALFLSLFHPPLSPFYLSLSLLVPLTLFFSLLF